MLAVLLLYLTCLSCFLAVMLHGEMLSGQRPTYWMRWLSSEKLSSDGCSHFLEPELSTLCFFLSPLRVLLYRLWQYRWILVFIGLRDVSYPKPVLNSKKNGKTNMYFTFFPSWWPVLGLILKQQESRVFAIEANFLGLWEEDF